MNKNCSKVSNKSYFVIVKVCKCIIFFDIVCCLYGKEVSCFSIWLCVHLLIWMDIVYRVVTVSSIFLYMKTKTEANSQPFADYYSAPDFVRCLNLLSG
jgi:hypothetical protein